MKLPRTGRARWLLACIVLLALSAIPICIYNGFGSADTFLAGPYLNSVGPDQALIVWFSYRNDPSATLTIQTDSGSRQLSPTVKPIPDAGAFLYVVRASDLQPHTRYDYFVRWRDDQVGGTFRTLTRSGEEPFTFALYGDHRSAPEDHRKVADAVAAENPLFVLSSGDFVMDGRVFGQWAREFFRPAAKLLGNTPLWTARGNHESRGNLYRALFELPEAEFYYGFDCGSASFIILDSNLEGPDQAAQLKWLKNHLTRLRRRLPQAWVFVVVHEPMFNIGKYNSRWGHADILPVLQEYGVDFVLSGHAHLYERIVPIRSNNGAVIQHIVSAGGGAPLYDAKPSQLLAHGRGTSVHHYCLFAVSPEKVTVTVKQPDGKVIDHFTVARPDPASSSSANEVFENHPDKPPVLVPAISQQQALHYQSLAK